MSDELVREARTALARTRHPQEWIDAAAYWHTRLCDEIETLKECGRRRNTDIQEGSPDAGRVGGVVDELEELRKAAKSVLLASAAGREPGVRQWARLADALDTEKHG